MLSLEFVLCLLMRLEKKQKKAGGVGGRVNPTGSESTRRS